MTRDYGVALAWFSKAAEHGSNDACADLARMYESGTGVPKDLVEAYKWYFLAAPSVPEALERKKELAPQLSPQQLDDALNRAMQWRTDHPATP